MSTQTEKAAATMGAEPGESTHTIDQLAELALLLASTRDAMSDDIVVRLSRAFSEGITLLDRLTRNEGLMHLLQVLERPESQHLLIGLSRALSQISREIAAAPPASGGIASLWRLAREPGIQEGLRSLSFLGQYWGESMRELRNNDTSHA